ncbi:MAG: amidohydrolase [Oscillospiraceae bacterium]
MKAVSVINTAFDNHDNSADTYIYDTFSVLHSMPELSFKEYRTGKFVSEQLESFGFEVITNINGSTAVMGVLKSDKPGPIIVLRADMDALPYKKDDGTEIALHTCGHDGHSAMLLACARIIAAEGGLPRGELRVLFQPAEEIMLGAKCVIESGVINDADAVVGIHLRPAAEAKLHEATPALCHGAFCELDYEILGKTAHGARPQLGVNAIEAATAAIMSVAAIHLDAAVPHSIKPTRIESGKNATNVIPEKVNLTFDARSQTNKVMDELIEKADRAVTMAAESLGAKVGVVSQERTVAAEYDPKLYKCAVRAIEKVLGSALAPIYTTGSEDFHYFSYLAGLKTVYIGLGADMKAGLHSRDMSFDISALADGVSILHETVHQIIDAL